MCQPAFKSILAFSFCFVLASTLIANALFASPQDDDLRSRLEDKNGARTDVWVYNDIAEATKKAREENKPLFVTFRCVPCKACAAFDADVANGNEKVQALAREKFISVRQVEMKDVDLSLFEFDHDLNWAGMFINADGTIYARYGTQSAEGPDAYNSIDGLLTTMNRVLQLHADYPGNRNELVGKRGSKAEGETALKMPGMRNAEKLEQETTRKNCIHCHMIHDAIHFQAQTDGTFERKMLWKFPLPENMGLKIDRTSGVTINEVIAGSPAAAAGVKPNLDIVRMNGQRIASIADIQWVLHKLDDPATVEIETSDGSGHQIKLGGDWKQTDISWRGSNWSVSPQLKVFSPPLDAAEKRKLGLPESDNAMLVKFINRDQPSGKAAFSSGLRVGDVIVELEGKPIGKMNNAQYNLYIKLNYKVGDEIPLTVLRDGERKSLRIKLVE